MTSFLKPGLHRCGCGETFLRRDYLLRHMRVCDATRNKITKPRTNFTSTQDKVYQCECGLSYDYHSNLMRHKKYSCHLQTNVPNFKVENVEEEELEENPGKKKKRISCVCGKMFLSTSGLGTHKLYCQLNCQLANVKVNKIRHSKPKRITCSCGTTFTSTGSYNRHRRTVCPHSSSNVDFTVSTSETSESTIAEDVAAISSDGTSAPQEQYEDSESPSISADVSLEPGTTCNCGRSFLTSRACAIHKFKCFTSKRIKLYKCPCGLKYEHRRSLLHHIQKKHDNDKKYLRTKKPTDEAPSTGTAPSSPPAFDNQPEDPEVDVKPFRCTCEQLFASEKLLVWHIKNVCGLDLRCPLCRVNHNFKKHLYFHMKDAHGIIPETVYPFRPEDEVVNHPSLPKSE